MSAPLDFTRPASSEEIAAALGKSKRSIERDAEKGHWTYSELPSHSRHKKRVYALKDLPEETRIKLILKRSNAILPYEETDHDTLTKGHQPILDATKEARLRSSASDPVRGKPPTARLQKQSTALQGTVRDAMDGDYEALSSGRDTKHKQAKKNDVGTDKKSTPLADAGGNQCDSSLVGIHVDIECKVLSKMEKDADIEASYPMGGNGGMHIERGSGQDTHREATRPQSNLPPLNKMQLRIHEAIKNIVNYVTATGLPKRAALAVLNKSYADGSLSKTLRWSLEHAWEKRRDGCVLNVSTYGKWEANFKERGHYAPLKRVKDFTLKPWHVLAVDLKRRPQGSSKRWIHAELVKALGEDAPGYSAMCVWFHEKLSEKDQLEGRYSGSQLRSKKFYQHRTSEGLEPGTLVHADGWNTHFSAPHPVTGEFVTYEVWHFHDVATRYVPKPGIGLTENALVITNGLENTVRELGVPARVQTDSTKVVKGADRFTKAMHSFEERLGFTWVHPKEVGNSQANGIAENFNTSWLDKRSRELATYQNRNSMDDLSFKRVRKLTGQMVKAINSGDTELRDQKKREIERVGKGLVFDTYRQAFDWVIQVCHEFNDRPHSSLKKITCPATGKRRYQTPREALNEHISLGWTPVALDEQELIDAFRPHVQVKVRRETVSPWGGMRYRNPEVLSHLNGKEVIVAYDMSDYETVWVKDLKGVPICEATFVEATRYHAVTAQQADEEKRAIAALKRLDKKRDAVIARVPNQAIEGEVLTPVPVIFREPEPELIEVPIPFREPEEVLKAPVLVGNFNKKDEEVMGSYQDTVMALYKEKTGND